MSPFSGSLRGGSSRPVSALRPGCHSLQPTGITCYLENKRTMEKAQAIAFHESPKTTKLYDRATGQIDADEIERIRI